MQQGKLSLHDARNGMIRSSLYVEVSIVAGICYYFLAGPSVFVRAGLEYADAYNKSKLRSVGSQAENSITYERCTRIFMFQITRSYVLVHD